MQITELAAKLQPLGLNDKEAKVYVAALFLGPSSVQKIAEQAGINRATAYVILDQLADLGLVSQSTERKKTVFIAEGPEALTRLFDRQKELIEERRQELKGLLPELKVAQRTETDSAPVVRFYRGKEGVAAINAESQRKAKPKSEIYGMVNYDKLVEVYPEVLKTNPSLRLRKKISSKVIYSFSKEVSSDPKILRQTKKVSKPIKADISLFDDIANLSTYAGKDSIGIAIESKEIVGALRQLFELAWENQEKKSK